MPVDPKELEALLGRLSKTLRAAFTASIRDVVDNARVEAIATALRRGDVEAALRAIGVDPAAFLPFDTALRQAFIEGGQATAAKMPRRPDVAVEAPRTVFRFDTRDPAAEEWLAENSSRAVTEIVREQRDLVRTALRGGMERGENPRTTALDIVGRQSLQTGRREGGIVGLTSQQAGYVVNARAELASGDPAQMARYLRRARRDKRFDGVVRRAIERGEPLDGQTVTRLTSRYADRLLQLRGETISRTETMTALNEAEFQTYRQAVDSGRVAARAVRKVWKATRDERTRDTHRELDGETVGLEERFPNGLLYPGDPAGAAAERINCRCRLAYRIDRFSNLE